MTSPSPANDATAPLPTVDAVADDDPFDGCQLTADLFSLTYGAIRAAASGVRLLHETPPRCAAGV